ERAEKAARAARRADHDPNAREEASEPENEAVEGDVSSPQDAGVSSAAESVPVENGERSGPQPEQGPGSQMDRPGGRRRRRRRRGRRPADAAAVSPGVTAPPPDKRETVE